MTIPTTSKTAARSKAHPRSPRCEPVRGGRVIPETLEPDGEAAGCNPAEMGSTPIGVSVVRPPSDRAFQQEGLGSRTTRIDAGAAQSQDVASERVPVVEGVNVIPGRQQRE